MTQPTLARRRWLAPEVVQTTEMDCGPASLKCLLEGHGVRVSYGRLREACQTDVDGTSIDTLEEIACQLGMDAHQVMLPVDHLLMPECQALPAIVVVQAGAAGNHFVVVWRRLGRWLQIMDPSIGRRWVRTEQFLRDVYRHPHPVTQASWREWAGSESFLAPLRSRMLRLGYSKNQAQQRCDQAKQTPGPSAIATLDAATRLTQSLIDAKALDSGARARGLCDSVFDRALERPAQARILIPDSYWTVNEGEGAGTSSPTLVTTGAVLVTVRKPNRSISRPSAEQTARPSRELVAALNEPPPRVLGTILGWMKEDGLGPLASLAGSVIASALTVLIQVLLFRGLIDLGILFPVAEQRLLAVGLLLAFVAGVLSLEFGLARGLTRLGRRLEVRARTALQTKIPLLGDRYFRSRPISDMTERSHSLQGLRTIPDFFAQLFRTGLTLVFTLVGVCWLDSQLLAAALAAGLVPLLLVAVTQPALSAKELRARSHIASLGRFYLDALRGLVAIRNHGAERSIRRQHESLLVRWSEASLSLRGTAVLLGGLQSLVGYGLAGWIVSDHFLRNPESSGLLLLVFWALSLPTLARQLGELAAQYPSLRNSTLRLLEPLNAPALSVPEQPAKQARSHPSGALGIRLENVHVKAAGRSVLRDVSLSIEPGEHVAVVGHSGAGKSSLLGLFLGWHRPSCGQGWLDEQPLSAAQTSEHRRQVAWIDPAIQIWNRSLLDNLRYGTPAESAPLGEVLDQADLLSLIERMPEGLQSSLGEGGGLVSGGEGQRLRLGRALHRPNARLVILDEPFRALDRAQRRRLTQRVRKHWQGSTLLMATHDLEETRNFDRVVLVDGGTIREFDRPQDLLARDDSLYREMLESEAEVTRHWWGSTAWRKWRIRDGRLHDSSEHSS